MARHMGRVTRRRSKAFIDFVRLISWSVLEGLASDSIYISQLRSSRQTRMCVYTTSLVELRAVS
jgi:hypothetical protein